MNQKGFTLIELVIVLIICGFLWSIAASEYKEYIDHILEQEQQEQKVDLKEPQPNNSFYINGVKYD